MSRILILLSTLVFAIAASHAAIPEGQAYWNKVLPNTPIPSAIKDLLPSTDEYTDNKYGKPSGTSVNVGKGGVTVNTGKPKPADGTRVNVGKGGVSVNTGKPKPGGTSVNVGHGGVIVNTPGKKKPVHVVVRKRSPFNYNYAVTDTQIRDDPNIALFFLEKDLKSGTKMTLHFTPTTTGANFVSRQEADSIPFSSTKFPEILKQLSIEPKSLEAETMKETISECEEPANDGETKYCATSLESMVDFSMASIGTKNIQAVSTDVGREDSPKQLYTVAPSGIKRVSKGSNLVVCHAQKYAYAVFLCHTTRETKAYQVAMVGKDGTKVEAVAVCHTDTKGWNPKHIAFRVLNVKPGTVPICHFLPQDHLVWSPKN